MADDIVFHIPGRSRFAGTHDGRDAARDYVESAIALSHDGDVEVELVDTLVSGERVALIVLERFTRVYRVRGEEIVEVWIFEADQYDVDALLGV